MLSTRQSTRGGRAEPGFARMIVAPSCTGSRLETTGAGLDELSTLPPTNPRILDQLTSAVLDAVRATRSAS
jgi:hypothetical protein